MARGPEPATPGEKLSLRMSKALGYEWRQISNVPGRGSALSGSSCAPAMSWEQAHGPFPFGGDGILIEGAQLPY